MFGECLVLNVIGMVSGRVNSCVAAPDFRVRVARDDDAHSPNREHLVFPAHLAGDDRLDIRDHRNLFHGYFYTSRRTIFAIAQNYQAQAL